MKDKPTKTPDRRKCSECGWLKKDHVRGTLKCKTRLKDTKWNPR